LYKIKNQCFFDEAIKYPKHDWARVFAELGLPVCEVAAESIAQLRAIGAHAYDSTRTPQWFGGLKGDLVSSERQQQRWCRETEALVRHGNEDFSRSFVCRVGDFTVHIGSNSCFCETGDGNPAILRFVRGDPSPELKDRWALEAVISQCPEVLVVSATSLWLKRFEKKRIALKQPQIWGSISAVLRFLKGNTAEPGCYILSKQAGAETMTIRAVSDEVLAKTRLIDCYRARVGLIQMLIGFRQTLSASAETVSAGWEALLAAAGLLDGLNAALCLERAGDALVLPLYLSDRSTVLIRNPGECVGVSIDQLTKALELYRRAAAYEVPELLSRSLHRKMATVLFARAVRERGPEGDSFAEMALHEQFLDRPFELAVKRWRVDNATQAGEDDAIGLAVQLLTVAQSDEEREDARRRQGHALLAVAQRTATKGYIDRAARKFRAAIEEFSEIGDVENLARAEGSLASVKRRLADQISSQNPGAFSVGEERALSEAARYYLTALERLPPQSPTRTQLSFDLISLYVSIIMRHTTSPPKDRMKPDEIIRDVDRYVGEAQKLLDKIPKSGDYARQQARLALWHGRFIAEFEIGRAPDPAKKASLLAQSIALYQKARSFFIADFYRVDYLDLTVLMAEASIAGGEFFEALKILMDSLHTLQPKTVAIRTKHGLPPVVLDPQAEARKELLKVKVRESAISALKGIAAPKIRANEDWSAEKSLLTIANTSPPDRVVELLLEIKKVFKL
jgi:tetratricopeptide (TPR) repeat protein